MPSSVDKTPTPHLAGNRPKNVRPVIVPAIPLPLVKRQQQQRQKGPVEHHENKNGQRLESKSEPFSPPVVQPSVPKAVDSEPLHSLSSSPHIPKASQTTSALASPRVAASTVPGATHLNLEVSSQPLAQSRTHIPTSVPVVFLPY